MFVRESRILQARVSTVYCNSDSVSQCDPNKAVDNQLNKPKQLELNNIEPFY